MSVGDMLQAQADAEDARRYRWLRTRIAHLLVGILSVDGDSLADISGNRADVLVDRHIKRDSERSAVKS